MTHTLCLLSSILLLADLLWWWIQQDTLSAQAVKDVFSMEVLKPAMQCWRSKKMLAIEFCDLYAHRLARAGQVIARNYGFTFRPYQGKSKEFVIRRNSLPVFFILI
jgi:hypothetical protein